MKEAPPRSWWKGLFGKYVISFVGLVVFLLVVNGGLESWFMYRDTTGLLVKAQSEKADATARRIEQFVSEVERQISWATRAGLRNDLVAIAAAILSKFHNLTFRSRCSMALGTA